MSERRLPATASALAGALPPACAARVRDVLAAAGADPWQALATLAAAIATLAVERVSAPLRPALLGAVAHVIAREAVLRSADPAGRG